MEKIDQMLALNKALINIEKVKIKAKKLLQEFAEDLYPGEVGEVLVYEKYFMTSEGAEDFLRRDIRNILDPDEISEYRTFASEIQKFEEDLEKFIEGERFNDNVHTSYGDMFGNEFKFEEIKEKFLVELISTHHISEIEEDSQELFKKLIELYGEEELADFSYTEFDEEYDEEYNDNSVTYRLSDFIWGHEDNLIGLVSNNELRQKLLASKLKWIQEGWNNADIRRYIQEYVESSKYGDELVILDEYGEVNLEDTLLCFSQLPISKDMNFYLRLADHLDEMQMPFEIFIKYINPEMREELINKRNGQEQGMTAEEYSEIMDEADEEIEIFYAEHPELDDRVLQIPKAISIDEYSKKEGTIEETIRPEREVSVSEIKEVAEGQTIASKNGAINAVTSPEEKKIVEGQSHNDE